VKALLDTNAFIWMHGEPGRLTASTRAFLSDEENELLLSAASAWEIAIKYGLGRLSLPVPAEPYVVTRMRDTGIAPLIIDHRHALHVAGLPYHHRDPFDRLLIAQAQLERIPIVTADRAFRAYDVEIIAA
jgi:PIN domain nuclease of toxin-antitoxin system